MSAFWIGFIGAWVGALSVAASLFILYKVEMHLRAKRAKEVVEEFKGLLEKFKFSGGLDGSSMKDNKFN